MNPHIQKALQHINNANYAGYFEELDKVDIPVEIKANYARHKSVFIGGAAPFDFHLQLMAFCKELNRMLSNSSSININNTNENENITIQGNTGSAINTGSSSKNSESKAKQKILFLAANPLETARLQLDREYEIIRYNVQESIYYSLLEPYFALTLENLLKALSQKPDIIHISVHGDEQGIILADTYNEPILMPNKALTRLFKRYHKGVKLIILNYSNSIQQAKLISEFGMYVIGVNNKLTDGLALSFSSSLYLALSKGKSIEEAYDDGMITLETLHYSSDNYELFGNYQTTLDT